MLHFSYTKYMTPKIKRGKVYLGSQLYGFQYRIGYLQCRVVWQKPSQRSNSLEQSRKRAAKTQSTLQQHQAAHLPCLLSLPGYLCFVRCLPHTGWGPSSQHHTVNPISTPESSPFKMLPLTS